MLPSFGLLTRKKLKDILDVTTNIVVVVFAVVAIGVLVKNYFAPDVKTSVAVKKGSVFPEIAGVDYKQTPRTLILALNVDCRYCTRSVPFYNSLAEARQQTHVRSTSSPRSLTRMKGWSRVTRTRNNSRCKRSQELT